jgi:uncharacterized protein YraI
MKRLIRFALASLSLASLSLVFPALAQAADGYVTGNVNLRAGPDSSYPLIDQIPAGTEVDVQGCTDGWEWCDVIAYGNRGWVAGNYIEYEYQDQPVLLPSYGAQIGIPIVSFVIGTYWDSYYRNRPFYRQRTQWYHRPIIHRPPPRPFPHPVRPGRPGSHGPGSRPGHLGPVGPGHAVRPVPGNRPNPGRPAQGNRPAPSRPGVQRPTTRPGQASGGRPGGNQRPPAQRPSTSPRPAPAVRPAPQSRPSNQRPGGAMNRPANRPAPAKGGNARPKQGDKKNDHGGH